MPPRPVGVLDICLEKKASGQNGTIPAFAYEALARRPQSVARPGVRRLGLSLDKVTGLREENRL